ncbi:MAG TPA: sigma-70 family RNA polymerase sigma factor [Gemmataceae bacterium]|nr:sigma-70 family RNA polymerase sigma factor [Gemmataceae bacterium]
MSEFRQPALKELTEQLAGTDKRKSLVPVGKRRAQFERAGQLLAVIDPAKNYPYPFVCYRVTGFRSDAYPDLLIPGGDLRHDLKLLYERLDKSLPPLPIEQVEEPLLTLSQVSRLLKVSAKTVRRWKSGCDLVGRRVLVNGRRHVGFPEAAVARFVAANRGRVERGGRFSHLTEGEKTEILTHARLLARGGGSLTEVSRRVARMLGRSAEAVRYTIRNFDRAYPAQAIFPDLTGPLDRPTKQMIFNSHRRGIPVNALAKRFRRTRASMYRVISEVRAEQLMKQAQDYIHNPSFDEKDKEVEILAPMPGLAEFEKQRSNMRVPKDVPPELAPLYEVPLLNKEQEQHLFRQMNFLKHKVRKVIDRFRNPDGTVNPAKVRIEDLEAIERLQEQATAVKDLLISCNMRLVVSIAKRHSGQTDNFFELLSDGNMSLMRAVEKFDYGRGNKFSTYASWAIMKNFARSIPEEKTRKERYVTGRDELFDVAPDNRTDEHELLSTAEQAAFRVNRLLEHLTPRDREIVRLRAGLDGSEPKTLEEIGKELGITKERVRQLNVRIMKQLRDIAGDQPGAEMS